MILIDAAYICQTGGRNLLDYFVDQFESETLKSEAIVLIDNRIKEFYCDKNLKKIKFNFIEGSELSRYRYYRKYKNKFRKVLCFANVPPPIRLDCEVMTFFQNVLLLDREFHKYHPIYERVLYELKYFLIKSRLNYTDICIVQTSHVKDLLVNNLKCINNQIYIIPFFNNETLVNPFPVEKKENTFFYPSTGDPHKNHHRLLDAWSNLYHKNKIKSELHITVDNNVNRFNELCDKICKLQSEGVPIINHGHIPKSEVLKLYSKCKFVIHPSLCESFGLVLIEALMSNCILIASDLPYVEAVVRPNYYFDATNIHSMEESILQALSGDNFTDSEILTNNDISKLLKYLT